MFYAIYHPYGTRTMSIGDALFRFATREERDRKVDDEPWDGRNYHWSAVTRAEARRLFPRAFANLDWPNSDERWENNIWMDRPTGGGYGYMG